jgi:hypothetical protein
MKGRSRVEADWLSGELGGLVLVLSFRIVAAFGPALAPAAGSSSV